MRYIFSLLILITAFMYPQRTYAHVLQSDGPIGAVMHITPDDNPLAGKQSEFYFEFKDKEEKFSLEACTCVVTISKAQKEIAVEELVANENTASFSFTFPETNVYSITVTGAPKSTNAFRPFTLTYDLRIEKTASMENDNEQGGNWFISHIPQTILGVASILILVIAARKQMGK